MDASGKDLSQFETKVFKKRTFSQIHKYLKCVLKTPTVPPTVRNGSNISTNGNEKCEIFNDYFVSTLNTSLSHLFQTCLKNGSFPDTWKLSQVTQIFKEGNRADVSCYRPITLLRCCSKILEEVLFDGIYMHTKDRLHESQFGFRKR